MERSEAAEEFVRMICNGYSGSVDTLSQMLERATGNEDGEWKEVREWFHERTLIEQKRVKFLIREAMFTALHNMLVQLDGEAEYRYVQNKPVDFAVTLNLYRDLATTDKGNVLEAVAICPTTRGEDLHDIFFHLADHIRKAKGL